LLGEATGVVLETGCRGAFGGSVVVHGVVAFHTFAQSGEAFGNSAKYLRWQDKAANQKFFAGDFLTFNKEAADLLLEIGIIKAAPKVEDLFDASYIK
jgi:hypothetical protein